MGLLKIESSTAPRRNFLVKVMMGIGAMSLVTRWGLANRSKSITQKFLTRDGRLVEVEISNLSMKTRPVNKKLLARWIWKKQEFPKEASNNN
jgi:hypothetical protein